MSEEEIKQAKEFLKYQIEHFKNIEKLAFLIDFICELDEKIIEEK